MRGEEKIKTFMQWMVGDAEKGTLVFCCLDNEVVVNMFGFSSEMFMSFGGNLMDLSMDSKTGVLLKRLKSSETKFRQEEIICKPVASWPDGDGHLLDQQMVV